MRLSGVLVLLAATLMATAGETQRAAPLSPEKLTFRFIGNQAFAITDGRITLVSDYPYQGGYSG